MKKRVLFVSLVVVLMLGSMAGCSNRSGSVGWTKVQSFSYQDIASWGAMQTPTEGSGSGSVADTNDEDGYVTIQAALDGWGGVESEYFEIDLSKEPVILAKISENPDGYNWGMKIVPENAIEDHEWGLYIIPDNNLKWNKYAGVNLIDELGQDYIDIYGETSKIKIWIYAAGGTEGTVSVSEILVMNTK